MTPPILHLNFYQKIHPVAHTYNFLQPSTQIILMDILIIRIFEEFLKHFSTGEKYKGKIKLEQTFLKKKGLFIFSFSMCSFKVWTIWEEQKIWKNLPRKIWHYWVTSNFKWKISSNFVSFSEFPNFKDHPNFRKRKRLSRWQDISSLSHPAFASSETRSEMGSKPAWSGISLFSICSRHSPGLLICTWFLKNQVVKINFDKLNF